MNAVVSVDVEDWFHLLALPSLPKVTEWDQLPSAVEKNFRRLLELFAERNTKVTCFFLGWIAERFPELVREAAASGHEVASHGYAHTLTSELTAEQFLADISRSKKILEDITGRRVAGYRAPGFSVTERSPWFFSKLAEAGYTYDSSAFPARRAYGGLRSTQYAPYVVRTEHGPIVEFPISVAPLFGRSICFFGGPYLRLAPYPLIKRMASRVLRQGRPIVFYVHPREIDPGHPRLRMSAFRRFRSYVGLATTEPKLRRILSDFSLGTFEELIANGKLASQPESTSP